MDEPGSQDRDPFGLTGEVDAAFIETPQVFVCDSSVEAEHVSLALRRAGYLVVEVPLAMLYSRVAMQRPNAILVDSDADGAFVAVERVRALEGAGAIDVLYLGDPTGAVGSTQEALERDGSAFFPRPVDVVALIDKLRTLTGGPRAPSSPVAPSARVSVSQLPSPSMRSTSSSPRPVMVPAPSSGSPSPLPLIDDPLSRTGRSIGARALGLLGGASMREGVTDSLARPLAHNALSHEMQELLAEAEAREMRTADSFLERPIATPEEEIESVLPAEVLAALDEPIEAEDHDESEPALRLGPGRRPVSDGPSSGLSQGTFSGTGAPVTTGGLWPHEDSSTPRSRPPEARRDLRRPREMARPPDSAVDMPALRNLHDAREKPGDSPDALPLAARSPAGADGLGTGTRTTGAVPVIPPPPREPPSAPRPPSRTTSVPPAQGPAALSGRDGARALGFAIATRASEALAFDVDGVIRRVVLREGDLVTASSTLESESLLAYLAMRGDLPRSATDRLVSKVPPFGRHAGAALVAHGHLRQEQLWPTLRGHAEWIVLTCMKLTRGTLAHELELTGRLKTEPSVFGGSAGAEVFVELARRLFSPDEAIVELGGVDARLGEGPRMAILSECALPSPEERLVVDGQGTSLGDILGRAMEPHVASVILGLWFLGIVDVIRPVSAAARGARDREDEESLRDIQAIDEDAARARIKARADLVDEGDYFAVLGVARDATGYEIRRAFLDLRRAFEPARILTPPIADLLPELRKINLVLEEAYEVLKDGARRERYRRAIEAVDEP